MKLFFAIAFLFISPLLFSQNTLLGSTQDSNSVIIHKDPRIDSLIKKQSQINEMNFRESLRRVKGYRILVINTNKRDDAIEAKSKMYTYFPELKPYLIYKSPNYRLKVGNFIKKEDAENYQKKINKYFPKGVFVVYDVIEVKPEEVLFSDNPSYN
ncbi:MAG: SPOR domain-containing protein [Bacteroidetes bacterium]|nr:SPOR domain-containing protein [Bacteroidota bacterium]MBS1632798.1 SPOR domain-containing protein [Bacteroidota bacterium]